MIGNATVAFLLAGPLSAAGNPRLEYALGVLAENRGQTAAAATHFETARMADPAAAPLVEIAVRHSLEMGDRPGAIQFYRGLAAARPYDLSVQLAYAAFLTEQGRGDALANKLAARTLQAALVKNPGHPEIIRRLFSLVPDERKMLLGTLSPDAPDAVLLFASLSRTLHETDDEAAHAEIGRRFRLAMEAHPENPALAREASEHFRNTNRLDEAIGLLQRHVKAAPWSLDLRVRIGILQFSAKQDDAGETMLKDVLSIHPKHALAHQALAKFYRLRGNPDRSADHAGELLKIRGGSPAEFLKLADGHLASGQARDARLLLEKAVFNFPEHPDLRMKLAIATQQDPETRARASRLFREAEAAFPDGKISDPAFLTTSAEALIASGQARAGEERLRAAVRAFPPDAKKETAAALRRLAALWQSENRNADAARAILQRANALDPK